MSSLELKMDLFFKHNWGKLTHTEMLAIIKSSLEKVPGSFVSMMRFKYEADASFIQKVKLIYSGLNFIFKLINFYFSTPNKIKYRKLLVM